MDAWDKMWKRRAPGIVKIEYVACKVLPRSIMLQSMTGATVTINAPRINVPFLGLPELSWSGSRKKGRIQEKSTLEFRSGVDLPQGRYAFLVTTASGEQYIIGTHEGRAPMVEYEDTTGKLNGDGAVRTYKVTHIAQKSVIRCVL